MPIPARALAVLSCLALTLPGLAGAATSVTTAPANLRRAPDVQAAIVGTVPAGSWLIVACRGDWCRTSYGQGSNHVSGYLARALTREVSRSAPLSGRGARFYLSCAAVRAAGRAPLRLGQPGYRVPLDPDHDGLACEPGE